jgi:general secretion pathway protein I
MLRHNQSLLSRSGFTLIEVLVALAIISISLTAIIKSTSQHIKDTTYLQDKMIANWVGLLVMNQVRTNLIPLTAQSSEATDELISLGKSWAWKASLKETPNPAIKEIRVSIFSKPTHSPLATLTSYQYVTHEK